MENMTSPAMPAQHGKGGTVALSIGLLVIGLVAGYFIGKGGTKPIVYQTTVPTITATPTPAHSITQQPMPTQNDETTNWKTYSLPGIEFKYPENWQPKTKTVGVNTTVTFMIPQNQTNTFTETFVVSYAPNQGGLTLDGWWTEASKKDAYQKVGNTTIFGVPAYMLAMRETDAPPRYIFITKPQNSVGWMFDITARGKNAEKVLATFKATE